MQIFSDNLAVVEVLTTGRARNHTLAACARNIWLNMSLYNIHLTFTHIAGKNVLADLLSRWEAWQPCGLSILCMAFVPRLFKAMQIISL